MAIMSSSLPREKITNATRMAKKLRISRSHLIEEALDQYLLEKQWEELKEYGHKLGKRLGIETDDDVEKYFG